MECGGPADTTALGVRLSHKLHLAAPRYYPTNPLASRLKVHRYSSARGSAVRDQASYSILHSISHSKTYRTPSTRHSAFIPVKTQLSALRTHQNMDASCGPSNAVGQLTKHAQRDHTLQRERFSGAVGAPAAFRSHGDLDGNLNQEFHRFSEAGGDLFQNLFQNPGHPFHAQFQRPVQNSVHYPNNQPMEAQLRAQTQFQNESQLNRSQYQNQFQNQYKQGDGWVQDFRDLSLQQPLKSGWQAQFMDMQRQGQRGSGAHARPMASMAPMLATSAQPVQREYQHQADGSLQMDEHKLAAQFDQIEQEMAESVAEAESKELEEEIHAELQPLHLQESQAMQPSRSNNEQFAEAARQVHDTMVKGQSSEETTTKFQQSNFLKLMALISERQVELSQEGDKLVTRTGQDIREYMSDPLKHERAEHLSPKAEHLSPRAEHDASYPPLHGDWDILRDRPMESETVRSHLPDPLAHIKDGQLSGDLSSLQAAQVISGGQVQADLWMEDLLWDMPTSRGGNTILSPVEQELFDDYRHDDDNF